MNAARAGRMLALLPELGKVSTPYALRLAGLSAAHDAKEIDLSRKNALQIQRLLAECMKDVLQNQESRLCGFLRHLIEKKPAGSIRICLAATLRFYSDTLRHPTSIKMPEPKRLLLRPTRRTTTSISSPPRKTPL